VKLTYLLLLLAIRVEDRPHEAGLMKKIARFISWIYLNNLISLVQYRSIIHCVGPVIDTTLYAHTVLFESVNCRFGM